MNRKELEKQIVNVCGESQLSAKDQLAALTGAQRTLAKFFAPAAPPPTRKDYKPLTRPSGKMMGKERRVVKESD